MVNATKESANLCISKRHEMTQSDTSDGASSWQQLPLEWQHVTKHVPVH